MKGLVLVVVAAAMLVGALSLSPAATAHRHGCHRAHECPSDHATYRWGPKRLLCVKRSSPKYNATFRIRVRYDGLTYWCKR